MSNNNVADGVSVATTVSNGLLASLGNRPGLRGAQTRFLVGQLQANAVTLIGAGGGAFFKAIRDCFEAAQRAGATYDAMDNVRVIAEGLTPSSDGGIATKNFCVRMALAELARTLAATTFKSRTDVDRFFDRIDAAFNVAEIVAADNRDNVAYRALVGIHAAVSNDLANRSRPLPRMLTYSFATRIPALTMAQRLYQDGSRGIELVQENKPVHPLFMPTAGAALGS